MRSSTPSRLRCRSGAKRACAIALAAFVGGLACGGDGLTNDAAAGTDGGRARGGGAGAQTLMCEGGRTRTFYRDQDGDGFGVPGMTAVHGCDGDTFEGLADNARDCDDTDPRRSPEAGEGWFDGRDDDCDGHDDPAGCIAAPGVPREHYATSHIIDLPPLDNIPVGRTPACDGAADLYIAVLGGCPVCGGGIATVVVANGGTIATPFRVTSNDQHMDVADALAPGRAADPLWLRLRSPESAITVSPLGEVSDCLRDNDAKTVRVGFTDCEAP